MYSGYIVALILAIGSFALAAGLTKFSLINHNIALNYSEMGSIYSTVAPMNVYFNNKVEAGSTST